MSKPSQPWKILPHGALTQLSSSLYTVNGRLYAPFGESTRRMSLVRLAGRRLAIFAPIPLREDTLGALERLGTPAYLVVPSRSYIADALQWQERYPGAQIVAPPALQRKLGGDSTGRLDLLDSKVSLVSVPGTGDRELALLVRSETGTTLVVHELMYNLPRARGLRGALMRAWGAGPGPCVPPMVKLGLIADREAVAGQLVSWAQMPRLQRVVMTAGEPLEQPRQVMMRLAEELHAGAGSAEREAFSALALRPSWVGRESRVG